VPATRCAIGDSLFGLEAYPGREGQLDLVLEQTDSRSDRRRYARLEQRLAIHRERLHRLGNGLEIPYELAGRKASGRAGRGRFSTSLWSSWCLRTASLPIFRLSDAPSPAPRELASDDAVVA
jgi:hypothetical protein